MNENDQVIWGLPVSFELFIGGFDNPQATLTIVNLNELAARERYIQQLLNRQKNSEIIRVHTPERETSTSPLVIGMSGTDPVALFAVETSILGKPFALAGKGALYGLARFGSGRTLNWAKAKLFSGFLNSSIPKSETSGIVSKTLFVFPLFKNVTRTVQDNGKIRLSLPSHTDTNPRQFVLEPLGNNKFYVHMRTWDGDHIPANLSNEDKLTLFQALYDELPEGGEILFPKSGPGYYGTRGTVAGLLRLSRDSRFTPGTKGILLYVDKDGTIKTYEGTSFIKKSVYEPRTSLRFFERPIVRSATENPYKIDLEFDLKDFFLKLKYHNKINGFPTGYLHIEGTPGFSSDVTKGLSSEAKADLMNNTVRRNIREFLKAGYGHLSNMQYRQKVSDLLDNVNVGRYTNEDYIRAGAEGTGGFIDYDRNFISVNAESPTFPVQHIERHEGRHLIDRNTSMLDNQRGILFKAYDDDFLNIPNTEFAENLKGYKYMGNERVTTNRDARDVLLTKGGLGDEQNLTVLDLYIDNASDDAIFNAVENANGYGSRFIQFLRANNKLTPEKAQLFREAMKHVGAVATPITVGTLITNNPLSSKFSIKPIDLYLKGGKIIEKFKNRNK